ncbi:hypothetical protein [Azospirillum sp. ST 5-10]|uniref:hypothetical protein n=1 Tax=unclassified Azospirillum TaxID=2630922 RepID=UPI003F49E55E
MAHESIKKPVSPDGPLSGDSGIDETRARNNADVSQYDQARTGVERRLQAQRDGRHIPATDASGKPYGHDFDPDVHEDGVGRTGSPGNEL